MHIQYILPAFLAPLLSLPEYVHLLYCLLVSSAFFSTDSWKIYQFKFLSSFLKGNEKAKTHLKEQIKNSDMFYILMLVSIPNTRAQILERKKN